MSPDLSPVIAATTQWLVRAYPGSGGALAAALAEIQARQAVTVAAWLRYPTDMDAGLVTMLGPGGSASLDRLVGGDCPGPGEDDYAWRTWVDEVVGSWAACLLIDRELAAAALAALGGCAHAAGLPVDFRRLTAPGTHESCAASLLRHPDLLGPVADLHRARLVERLEIDAASC